MSRLGTRITTLERALRPEQSASGTIEWHYTAGGEIGSSSSFIPCDKRDEHGPDCVMSVSPTDDGVRFMRIIEGMKAE